MGSPTQSPFLIRLAAIWLATAALAAAQAAYYHPGFNFFSPQQDIQIGRQAAAQQLHKLPALRNAAAQALVNHLGRQLAQHMPGPRFPYQFHLVNSPQINAFALPGGPIFINRGAICAAQNTAQLAGILAHEESHVALRHSTHMASQQEIASFGLGLLGSIFGGGGGAAATVARLGTQIGVSSLFLHYSRQDESQADALGAAVMSASGYDPRQMAAFFQTLEQHGGGQAVQFLSDHPNPGDRMRAIQAEILNLPPHPPYQHSSAALAQVQRQICPAPVR